MYVIIPIIYIINDEVWYVIISSLYNYTYVVRYEPPDLTDHCDGCGEAFSIYHDLDLKKGGLITSHHNNLCDGVADLASNAFTPTHVHGEPQNQHRSLRAGGKDKLKGLPSKDKQELKGVLLIRDLWMHGTDSIHDICVMNTEAPSYLYKTHRSAWIFLRERRRGSNFKPVSNSVGTSLPQLRQWRADLV